MNRRSVLVLPTLALLVLAACGGTPPVKVKPVGRVIESRVESEAGPRIPVGSLFVAGDLATLRALVDGASEETARELGVRNSGKPCLTPDSAGPLTCWPKQTTRPDQAYAALYISGGWCQQRNSVTVSVQERHLYVAADFSAVPNCRIMGIMAMPTAALVSFSTKGLPAGLYEVSYSTSVDGDTYRSVSTYLSLPSPSADSQADMEAATAGALESAINAHGASLFSVSRVDGSQLQALCSAAPAGPTYLVIYPTARAGEPRKLNVVLAGSPVQICSTTSI
jgi:hypothetical protein